MAIMMHEQVMKVLDKIFCDFFMEFAGFFCNFWKFDGFPALLDFRRGGRACNKIEI